MTLLAAVLWGGLLAGGPVDGAAGGRLTAVCPVREDGRLANGVTYSIESDPLASNASVRVRLSVGSADDPEQVPGLAHLIEHLLLTQTRLRLAPGRTSGTKLEELGLRLHGGTDSDVTMLTVMGRAAEVERMMWLLSEALQVTSFDDHAVRREIDTVHNETEQEEGKLGYPELRRLLTREGVGAIVPALRWYGTPPPRSPSTVRKRIERALRARYARAPVHVKVLAPYPLPLLRAAIERWFGPLPARETDAEERWIFHRLGDRVRHLDQFPGTVLVIYWKGAIARDVARDAANQLFAWMRERLSDRLQRIGLAEASITVNWLGLPRSDQGLVKLSVDWQERRVADPETLAMRVREQVRIELREGRTAYAERKARQRWLSQPDRCTAGQPSWAERVAPILKVVSQEDLGSLVVVGGASAGGKERR